MKNSSKLSDILEPGEYIIDGERFVIYDPIDRDAWRGVIAGIKKFHSKYYEC